LLIVSRRKLITIEKHTIQLGCGFQLKTKAKAAKPNITQLGYSKYIRLLVT